MMVVITLTNCPPKVRGDLSKWMIEIDSGVFVGNLNARVRDAVWNRICLNIKNGRASMAYSTNNEQKLDFRIHNTEWEPVDFDGIKLIRIKNKINSEDDGKALTKAEIYHRNRLKQKKVSSVSETDTYIVLDIETTGVNVDDSIIEIAALKIVSSEVVAEFHEYVKFDKELPEQIVKMTGITNEFLALKGIPLKNAIENLKKFIEGYCIVGHNIIFDMNFLQRACSMQEIPLISNRTVDTLRLARKSIDDISSFKLSALAEYFGISTENEHHADGDCLMTYRIYEKLKEM